jgi:hypothetical protein
LEPIDCELVFHRSEDTVSQNDDNQNISEKLGDQARGAAERAVLGQAPAMSMLRIAGFIILFVLLFGTVFYLAMR